MPLLSSVEVEETQGKTACTVRDMYEQRSASAVSDFGVDHLALNYSLIAMLQAADGQDPRAVFVAKR